MPGIQIQDWEHFSMINLFFKTGINLSPILMPIENGDILYEFPENRNRLTFKGLPGLLADIQPDKNGPKQGDN